MRQAGSKASCVVFEERIVVTGGDDTSQHQLSTVESYDVTTNSWSPMAEMVEGKRRHSSVVVRNKLFVLGCEGFSEGFEVYDSTCKIFVALKRPAPMLESTSFGTINNVVAIGSKLFALMNATCFFAVYDVEKGKWSKVFCDITEKELLFSSIKVPHH